MATTEFRLFDKTTQQFFVSTYEAYNNKVEYPILNETGALAFVVMDNTPETKIIGDVADEYKDRFVISTSTGICDIAIPTPNKLFTGDILFHSADLSNNEHANTQGYYLIVVKDGSVGWIGANAGVFHPFVREKIGGILCGNIWQNNNLLSEKQLTWWKLNVF